MIFLLQPCCPPVYFLPDPWMRPKPWRVLVWLTWLRLRTFREIITTVGRFSTHRMRCVISMWSVTSYCAPMSKSMVVVPTSRASFARNPGWPRSLSSSLWALDSPGDSDKKPEVLSRKASNCWESHLSNRKDKALRGRRIIGWLNHSVGTRRKVGRDNRGQINKLQ